MSDWIDAYWHFWRDLDAGGARYYVGAVVTVFLLLGILVVGVYALMGALTIVRGIVRGVASLAKAFWLGFTDKRSKEERAEAQAQAEARADRERIEYEADIERRREVRRRNMAAKAQIPTE